MKSSSFPCPTGQSECKISYRKVPLELWDLPALSRCSCVCSCLQVIRKGEVSCCWTCTPCKENEFVFDEYTCRACILGSWPTDDLTGTHFVYVSLTYNAGPDEPPNLGHTLMAHPQIPLTSYVPDTHRQTGWHAVIRRTTAQKSTHVFVTLDPCQNKRFGWSLIS